jgi:nitric oxide reductase large subunit
MSSTRKLWISLAVLLVSSFGVLLWMGASINQNAPPMPERVVDNDGRVIYTRADIEKGRTVWQSMGGMQLGSIWGHGGYVAPDWSADWLHREATAVLDFWTQRETGEEHFDALPAERQAALLAGWSRAYARIRTIRLRKPCDWTPIAPLLWRSSQSITNDCSETLPKWTRYAMHMR